MSSTGHLSELDLLRGQVADLSRELAERDRAAQDLREQSDLLRAIVAGTAAETGEEFFASLVTHLTSVLHVQYAIIGEVQGDHIKKIRTLAVSAGCHLIDNFEYELAHTPCATALTQSFACFHRDVQATFPQFQRLADLAAESYCAVPLRTKSGAVIGLLVVMDTKPLQHSDSLQSLLGVFAPRIAAEFERKRAEQERAQAQAQADLHNVIETIPDVVFALNRQGNLVKWNRRLTVVTGYSPEELLNKSALAFVPPEEQASTAAAIQRVFTEGYAELEGHMQTKDHRLIPYHWTGALLKNSHGEPVGITGIGRDVSEKKRAEEELKQQRGHLLDAQALAHLGSWAWDIDSGKEQWSDEQFRIFGYEPGTIAPTYDTFLTALHPDDYDRVLAAINDALVGKRAYDVEYRIIRPNGEVRFIHARGDSHRDATGDPLRMAGTVLDITESKRAEEALWESEARFRSMADTAPVLIWMSDTGKLCTYFNQRWLDYTGRTMEQELGNGWAEGVHPDDLDRCLKTYVEAFDRHESFQMEYRLRKLDGQYGWLLDNGVPRQLPSGKFAGYIHSCIDITDQKQTQEALAQSERQLRTVLDALPVGVWFTDRSGKPLFGNPAAKEMWSNTKQIGLQTENNQAGWWETVGSANEPHRWALSHVLATGVPSLNETFDLECLDGTKKTIRNSTVPVQDGDGNILGAIVLNEDITLLRQAQAALQLTQFSVDHAVEGFFWIGPDARIFHVNDSACRMLEYTWEELTTMTLHDIDPNLSSEVWPAHWEELKEKGSLTFESKYWSRTGRVLDIEVTVNYLQYERKEYICAIMRDIEERKRGEAALRASEERYRVLYDETPTMYFTLATDGTVLSVNRFGAEQLGYQVDELIGHSVLGLFHEQDKEAVAAKLAECLATPEAIRLWEFRKVRKDGNIIWVQETVRVGQSSTGETVVLVTCSDITERKRMEEALTFFRTLLDHVDDSIEIIDPRTGQFLDGNRGAAANIGYTRDEFLALTVPDIDPLVTRPVFAGMMERLQEAPDPIILGSIHRRKDGTTFPVEVSAQLIRLDKEYLVAIVRDITERKRAEEAVKASEQRLRDILDSMFAFVGLFSTDGIVLETNTAPLKAAGLTREEVIGRPFAEAYWWSYSPAIQAELRAALSRAAQGEIVRYDVPVRIRNEQLITIDVAFAPLFNKQGQVTQIVGSAVDITDRKRMEETLRQREHALRAAIEERERISQDLHDGILQSLFAVGLTLEVSKSMMSTRVRKTSEASLNQAIDQLNDVMGEIRNFIAGLGCDLLEGKDLSMALQRMLALLTKNRATRVRLAVEDRAAKAVSAEQSLHLFRVIQEAVSNCIRHGHAQEARVSLKMLKQGVRLSIRDNGRGFKQGAAQKTGHGLANMAARAEKLGGRFTVLSKVNAGTSIVLDLPKEVSDVPR